MVSENVFLMAVETSMERMPADSHTKQTYGYQRGSWGGGINLELTDIHYYT